MSTVLDTHGNLHSTDDGRFAEKHNARPKAGLSSPAAHSPWPSRWDRADSVRPLRPYLPLQSRDQASFLNAPPATMLRQRITVEQSSGPAREQSLTWRRSHDGPWQQVNERGELIDAAGRVIGDDRYFYGRDEAGNRIEAGPPVETSGEELWGRLDLMDPNQLLLLPPGWLYGDTRGFVLRAAVEEPLTKAEALRRLGDGSAWMMASWATFDNGEDRTKHVGTNHNVEQPRTAASVKSGSIVWSTGSRLELGADERAYVRDGDIVIRSEHSGDAGSTGLEMVYRREVDA